FSSRRRHTRFSRDWSSDVCSSDLPLPSNLLLGPLEGLLRLRLSLGQQLLATPFRRLLGLLHHPLDLPLGLLQLLLVAGFQLGRPLPGVARLIQGPGHLLLPSPDHVPQGAEEHVVEGHQDDRKSTRLNSSHVKSSYA